MYNRIISLLPAATEIIYALGSAAKLVGRSHECDFPETVKHLPACTAANIPEGLSSAAINKQVKQLLGNALSVYTINDALLRQLEPDLIITQSQCEACAVSLSDVEQAVHKFTSKPVKIISLHPESINDIFNNIKEIAAAAGAAAAGDMLTGDLQDRIDIIRHKLKYIQEKPTVACIEWIDPLMISGNWIPGLVELAGGIPVLTNKGKPSAFITPGDLISQNPDIIIIMPCGFAIERTMREIQLLLALPGFNELNAVKNNKIYIADGNQYFNRPGPRIVDSAEILAEIINPKQFIFGLEGNSWVKFNLA